MVAAIASVGITQFHTWHVLNYKKKKNGFLDLWVGSYALRCWWPGMLPRGFCGTSLGLQTFLRWLEVLGLPWLVDAFPSSLPLFSL